MKKFNDKYRIPSARAQWWDYSRDGIYFITICTKNSKFYFGDIADGKMHLSNVGVIADILWHEIPNHAKNITLGEFQVMPNHIHGIIILDGNENGDDGNENGGDNANPNLETRHALSLQSQSTDISQQSIPQTPGQKRFRNPGKNSVSTIIGSYKSAVTKHAHRLGYKFQWQSRMWDNIIFNQESFDNITEYIRTNVEKWEEDKFHPNNQKSTE
jgi:REP element-mobilizing transposase RayT